MLRKGAADRLKEPGGQRLCKSFMPSFSWDIGNENEVCDVFFFYRVNALGERDVLRPSARTVGCQGICI